MWDTIAHLCLQISMVVAVRAPFCKRITCIIWIPLLIHIINLTRFLVHSVHKQCPEDTDKCLFQTSQWPTRVPIAISMVDGIDKSKLPSNKNRLKKNPGRLKWKDTPWKCVKYLSFKNDSCYIYWKSGYYPVGFYIASNISFWHDILNAVEFTLRSNAKSINTRRCNTNTRECIEWFVETIFILHIYI